MNEHAFFEHLGENFRILNESPAPNSLKNGDWVRICYDPHSGKSDIVALVVENHPIWPLNHGAGPGQRAYLPNDHQLELARNGDHTDTFKQLFSDEYIELVAKVDERPKSQDTRRLGRQQ
ncbi:hypothetical protein [Neorhizobium galegae]|uniref:hypothetical protein n=1 Tax=Neorhizobium galegae TaxID=399 RepID=UPI001F47EBE5|nr:hypothetical protein [Neorhizobium galegae]UIK04760.1 hypothetical protein LZK81_19165 [Neorhizobium galegae]